MKNSWRESSSTLEAADTKVWQRETVGAAESRRETVGVTARKTAEGCKGTLSLFRSFSRLPLLSHALSAPFRSRSRFRRRFRFRSFRKPSCPSFSYYTLVGFDSPLPLLATQVASAHWTLFPTNPGRHRPFPPCASAYTVYRPSPCEGDPHLCLLWIPLRR